jgi:hypothetical protein
MGIRVNKLIGYGITDLVVPKDKDGYSGTPTDPRWDYAKYTADWRGGEREASLKDFISWIKKRKNAERVLELADYEGWNYGRPRADTFDKNIEMFLMTEALKDRVKRKDHWHAPYDAVIWHTEGGKPEVVLFQCPEHADWHRHDSIIDYYEEKGEGRATPLNNTGIWPYDGFMRRFRLPTPEVATKLSAATKLLRCFALKAEKEKDGADIAALNGGEYNQFVGRWDSKLEPLIEDPDILKHLLNDWRPRVPLGILACMEFLGCFPNLTNPDSMLNSLRPMVYVYWG